MVVHAWPDAPQAHPPPGIPAGLPTRPPTAALQPHATTAGAMPGPAAQPHASAGSNIHASNPAGFCIMERALSCGLHLALGGRVGTCGASQACLPREQGGGCPAAVIGRSHSCVCLSALRPHMHHSHSHQTPASKVPAGHCQTRLEHPDSSGVAATLVQQELTATATTRSPPCALACWP
jgi:hypothetical protein